MIGDPSHQDALALLSWQVELGADEAILEAPTDRFALGAASARPAAPKPVAAGPAPPAPSDRTPDATERAAAAAGAADEGLALDIFLPSGRFANDHHPGRAGQLLDRMLTAIGLSRRASSPDAAVYITNMLPWRPPQNRDPTAEELSMLGPFVRRHIELADPEVLVLMGNFACQGLIGRRGITRLRGTWAEVLGRPALPMFHPAYLLRRPYEKAKAWADLLALQARLRGD